MVVADLDVEGIPALEPEADPPPVVDRDRVLALTIALQPVQSVAWRNFEIIKTCREVYVLERECGSVGHVRRKPFALPGQVELPGPLVRERLDNTKEIADKSGIAGFVAFTFYK